MSFLMSREESREESDRLFAYISAWEHRRREIECPRCKSTDPICYTPKGRKAEDIHHIRNWAASMEMGYTMNCPSASPGFPQWKNNQRNEI